MEELNRRAARAIFRENNEHRDDHTIDLHGLFVKVRAQRNVLLSSTQAGHGKTVEQEQEQISPNHLSLL